MPGCRFLLLMAGVGLSIYLPVWAAAEGRIAANPNPCVVAVNTYTCTTYLSWTVSGAKQARVYVVEHSKQGNPEHQFKNGLVCNATSAKCRAPWIRKGNTYDFTLYDYSSGSRGRALSSVTVTAAGWSRR
jgi:hypothetical protein